MAQNDPDPDKFVKICPDCFYRNDASLRRCFQCDKSLAGVQPEPFPTGTLQKPLADETSINTMVAGISSSQLHVQQIQPSGQHTANGSAPSPQSASTVTHRPGKPQVHIPSPGLSSYPNSPNRNSSGRTKTRRNLLVGILLIVLVVLVIFFGVFLSRIGASPKSSSQNSPIGLGEFKASNGELLGVNDGSFPSFVPGPDGSLKQQAIDQLKLGHRSQAISLWQAAIHISNNDAEAWIYLENQLVLLSGQPYVTLVAGTDLFAPFGAGQNDLQGIYVAQHEFNNANHSFRLRILIANSGTDINNVTNITQQIVHIATKDKTIVGVISWLTSTENITALPLLNVAHIPMISPGASSDVLTNSSPFFFRIVSPNKVQGKQTALFAEHALHAQKVVVFLDRSDPYSQNLAQVFERQFRQDGRTILKEEFFTTDHTDKIGDLIQDALKSNPDLFYFTSRDTGDVKHFQDKLPTTGTFAQLPAIAGDSGYTIEKAGYGRWYFASPAFANAAENAIGTSSPPFYQDYSDDFNKDGRKHAGFYGYTRPDNIAMLSYDVTSVFLKAIQQVITNTKITVTSDGLQTLTPLLLANTLPNISLQGVTGAIAFGPDHDPVNKTILFIGATSKGFYLKGWQGCFTKNVCRT